METKVQIKSSQTTLLQEKKTDTFLDTLAQLRHCSKSDNYKGSKIVFQKRARSKYITNNLAIRLADLHSDLEKYYRNAYYCNDTILQEEKTLTAKYCNTRICLNCNRIRTAKLINGYYSQLLNFSEPYFVTVTIPNVSRHDLKPAIVSMMRNFDTIKSKFYENSRRHGSPIFKGIRKLEVTYNSVTNMYHPHYHFIINSEIVSNEFISSWLTLFPEARKVAQDSRPADENSIKELFKYVTKILVKDKKTKGYAKINIDAIDVIMTALKGLRTFQPFGGVKIVSEDVKEIEKQEYNFLDSTDEYNPVVVWTWDDMSADWVDTISGQVLSDHKVSETMRIIVKSMDVGK
jgi:hypothetical protein